MKYKIYLLPFLFLFIQFLVLFYILYIIFPFNASWFLLVRSPSFGRSTACLCLAVPRPSLVLPTPSLRSEVVNPLVSVSASCREHRKACWLVLINRDWFRFPLASHKMPNTVRGPLERFLEAAFLYLKKKSIKKKCCVDLLTTVSFPRYHRVKSRLTVP